MAMIIVNYPHLKEGESSPIFHNLRAKDILYIEYVGPATDAEG